MYGIIFYVPESHLEIVKNAMFEQGAGKVGNYDHCSWQVLGTGQYRPLPGSQPFQGEIEKISQEAEYKVEMVCEELYLAKVVAALLIAHPYETPAYMIHKLISPGTI